MGKSIKKLAILAIAASVFLLFGGSRETEAARKKFVLEQTSAVAPDVKAYIGGTYAKEWSGLTFDATITNGENEIALSQTAVTKFEESGEGIHYIVLLDNSGSVDKKQLNHVRKELGTLEKELGEQDKLTVYTVGTKKKNGTKTKVNRISAIRSGAKYTVLYRSINEILAEEASVPMRTVLLLITDGEDDSEGKDNSIENTVRNVKNAAIPVYGILLKNTLSNQNKKKMKATENEILADWRGDYEKCNSLGQVSDAFQYIKKVIQKETYIVTFRAADNRKFDGISNIKISTVENALEGMIDYSKNTQDQEPPYIAGEITKTGESAIRFSLCDNSGIVKGADEKGNYIIKSTKEGQKTPDEEAKTWAVKSVHYNAGTNEVEITFENPLLTGKYHISFQNITDGSQEANALTEQRNFSFEGLDPSEETMKELAKNYWWILVILAVIIIGVIVIIVMKRRRPVIIREGTTAEEAVSPDTKRIKLVITDRAGQVKEVEWNVEGSIFIGRSEMCNIFFDDDRLSRQHFAIEVTKVACYIEDLETTNGTFVNGVRLNTRMIGYEINETFNGNDGNGSSDCICYFG